PELRMASRCRNGGRYRVGPITGGRSHRTAVPEIHANSQSTPFTPGARANGSGIVMRVNKCEGGKEVSPGVLTRITSCSSSIDCAARSTTISSYGIPDNWSGSQGTSGKLTGNGTPPDGCTAQTTLWIRSAQKIAGKNGPETPEAPPEAAGTKAESGPGATPLGTTVPSGNAASVE